MNTVIIESIVSVLSNLAITLIGVAGACLVTQIAKTQQLNTINAALGELTNAAEQTEYELQQGRNNLCPIFMPILPPHSGEKGEPDEIQR